MPLKELFAPHRNRTVKMGRKRSKQPARMHLKNYLTLFGLPAPPPSVDYWTANANPALINIYENDTLGDCVIAGGYHIDAVWTGNAGNLFTATNAQITADYSAIGGYVPGDEATDDGCDMQTAMNYWQKTGMQDGSKLAGWIAIDPTNTTLLQQAFYLFENLYFGIELPDAWVNPMPQGNGFVWDVAGAPDPQNGHCIMATGYGPTGFTIDSWGLKGTLTFAAAAKYCVSSAGGELYALVSQNMLIKAQQKAPNGLDWPTLIADFDTIGGTIPVPVGPSPTPVPSPSPTPTPTPTPQPTPAPAGFSDVFTSFNDSAKTFSLLPGWMAQDWPMPFWEFTTSKIVLYPKAWTQVQAPTAHAAADGAINIQTIEELLEKYGPTILAIIEQFANVKAKAMFKAHLKASAPGPVYTTTPQNAEDLLTNVDAANLGIAQLAAIGITDPATVAALTTLATTNDDAAAAALQALMAQQGNTVPEGVTHANETLVLDLATTPASLVPQVTIPASQIPIPAPPVTTNPPAQLPKS